MSRYRSDEQREAEAAGHGFDNPDANDPPAFRPTPPPKPHRPDGVLRRLILDLRATVRSEVPERIHASSTPRLLNDDGTTDRKDADEQGLGLPLTSRMHRYIGHWSHWGTSRLADLSIMEVSDWCHARHTDHSIPGATRSLCAMALHALSRGTELDQLAALPGLASLHGMRPDQRDAMLVQALNHAREWRIGQERRSKGARFDGPDPLPYEPLRRRRLTVSA